VMANKLSSTSNGVFLWAVLMLSVHFGLSGSGTGNL